MSLLIGLDIGTTSVKAGVFEASGRQLSAVGQEYRIDHPAPDRAEIDAETYWGATVAAVRRALVVASICGINPVTLILRTTSQPRSHLRPPTTTRDLARCATGGRDRPRPRLP